MKKINIKRTLLIISIIIFCLALFLGFRYIKYYNFIGKYYSDSGDYYQFNLFSWLHSNDGTDKQKCSLWDCNIEEGSIFYTKDKKLYLRYNKNGVFITNYKIEKKNNKTYLYLYNDSNELEHTYIKN